MIRVEIELSVTGGAPTKVASVARGIATSLSTFEDVVVHRITVEEADA